MTRQGGPKALGLGAGVHTGTAPAIRGGVLETHDGFSVGDCMKKNQDKVDDPGAYCASIQDKISGTTKWRGHPSKEVMQGGILMIPAKTKQEADSGSGFAAQLRDEKKQ